MLVDGDKGMIAGREAGSHSWCLLTSAIQYSTFSSALKTYCLSFVFLILTPRVLYYYHLCDVFIAVT